MYLETSHSTKPQNAGMVGQEAIEPATLPFPVWLQRSAANHAQVQQAVADAVLVVLSLLTAYLVRYDGGLFRAHLTQFLLWAPILIASRLLANRAKGVYRFLWKFVCLADAIAIARSQFIVTGALVALRMFYPEKTPFSYWLRLPLGIIVPEYLLCLLFCLGIRAVFRIANERSQRTGQSSGERAKRILLYGAGRAGILLTRELMSHADLEIVGFVDDDPKKLDTVISGIRVLGGGESLENLVHSHSIDEVIISIAAASPKTLTRILSTCKRIPIMTRMVPSAEEVIAGRVKISHVREIQVEDLLGRHSVTVGEFDQAVRRAYHGKHILVTGAGGSIGSELTRQLLLLNPSKISILDKDENSIFELEHELKFRNPEVQIAPLIADIKIRERVFAVLSQSPPEIVFHAAAHKHVPLMEQHPCEAVLNNVMGTKNILEICRSLKTEQFVFISSDKAVNPVNVMGATKRVGEKLVSTFIRGGPMRGAAVRFGNVMGSRGSVIPLFQKQIEEGGPVTVTHADIVRFFMTIPEAVQLVLCAGSMAHDGEIFVLDMGNPRRVLDLARQMIELTGLEPEKDIPIAITGLRPGEKMNEELVGSGEALDTTSFEKVFKICSASFDEAAFRSNFTALILAAQHSDHDALYALLTSMKLGYTPPFSFSTKDPESGLAYAS